MFFFLKTLVRVAVGFLVAGFVFFVLAIIMPDNFVEAVDVIKGLMS